MAVTPNLGLHQWEPGDAFLRTEFNQDFLKLDGAVGEKARMVCGMYIGNEKSIVNSANSQEISLGFTPRAVLVYRCNMSYGTFMPQIALAVSESPVAHSGYSALEIVSGGFRAGSVDQEGRLYNPALNAAGATYHYLALK